MKKVLLVSLIVAFGIMAFAAGAQTQSVTATTTSGFSYHAPAHRFGLASPMLFGWAIHGNNGQVIGYQGISYGIGYAAKYYFNPDGIQPNQFNGFWEWGTVALILPYIGIGADYIAPLSKMSDLVFTIGAIYVIPYIGISFDF